MERTPEVTTLEVIYRKAGYQSLEPVNRPPYWGVDRDMSRRPGVPMQRAPRPWPNSRPIEPMPRERATMPKHGRSNRDFPPVFGTTVPPHGLSGALRMATARWPDHKPQYWLTKMLADRIDNWGYRARKLLPFALPFAALGALIALAGRRGAELADLLGD